MLLLHEYQVTTLDYPALIHLLTCVLVIATGLSVWGMENGDA